VFLAVLQSECADNDVKKVYNNNHDEMESKETSNVKYGQLPPPMLTPLGASRSQNVVSMGQTDGEKHGRSSQLIYM